MKKSLLLFGTLAILTTLGGCFNDWTNCYTGNGVYGETYRELDDFDAVTSNSSIDIELIWDSIPGANITGDDNLIDLVETRVVGNSLVIDYQDRADCINQNQRMVVEVHFNNLEQLTIDGSGDIFGRDTIFSKDLKVAIKGSGKVNVEAVTDYLLVDVDGSGDVSIDGYGLEGHVNIDGSADVDLFDYEVEDLGVEIDGSGDVKATVSEELKVWMNGSGDVTYRGDADLIVEERDGSGEIRKL